MYGKVFDWVKGGFGKAISYVSVAVTVVSVTAIDVLAQEAAPVFTAPAIDFTGVAAPLVTALTTAAVAGMGIGLSLWALMMIPRFFRRAAK